MLRFIQSGGGSIINQDVNIGASPTFSTVDLLNGKIPSGIDWVLRNTPGTNAWLALAYGNGLFVAVAISGTGDRVMTSPDGVNWTLQSSAADNSWRSITYGNGLFVAVATSGTGDRVMTSPDGVRWTSRFNPVDNSWRSVTYGNGLFVAVATSGTGDRVMTSPDGINWTLRSSPADNQWNAVAYGNGLFVAVSSTGTGNRVMTSPDGINWTLQASAADFTWSGVVYGNGLFVASSGTSLGTTDRIMTSPDAVTWTSRPTGVNNGLAGLSYANGLFVGAISHGSVNKVILSIDGVNWQNYDTPLAGFWAGVVYGNGIFCTVSSNNPGTQAMTSGVQVTNTPEFNTTLPLSLSWGLQNDTATAITPISHTGGAVNTFLTNDNLGPQTFLFNPNGFANLWDSVTNSFNLTTMGVGDLFALRIDIIVTTSQPNQEFSVVLDLAIGSGFDYTLPFMDRARKNAGSYGSTQTSFIGIANEITKDYPAKLRFVSTDNASIQVNGWATVALKAILH